MNVLSSMLFKFPCLFTKPFPACEGQAAFTQACTSCLANVTPFCQRLLFDVANTQAPRAATCWVTPSTAARSFLLLPSSEERASGPWTYLIPLKSKEEQSDILLVETQCGKGSNHGNLKFAAKQAEVGQA